MGRQYVSVKLYHNKRCVKNINALIDTQFGYIPNSKMRELIYSEKWLLEEVSLELESPYTIKEKIEYVVVDDKPLDISEGEDMIIGLDFMQKVGITIKIEKE